MILKLLFTVKYEDILGITYYYDFLNILIVLYFQYELYSGDEIRRYQIKLHLHIKPCSSSFAINSTI